METTTLPKEKSQNTETEIIAPIALGADELKTVIGAPEVDNEPQPTPP